MPALRSVLLPPLRCVLLPLSVLALLCACAAERPPIARAKPPTWVDSPNGEPLPFRAGANDCRATLAAWFAKADGNGDGVLTLAEMQADADRWFALADQDHDGYVVAAELAAIRAQIVPVPDPEPETETNLPPHRRQLPALQARLDPVMQADANADFRVSAQEFRDYVAGQYAEATRTGPLTLARVQDACTRQRP